MEMLKKIWNILDLSQRKRSFYILLITQQKSGDPGGHRTCNYSLGGSRYIHLTTGPNL